MQRGSNGFLDLRADEVNEKGVADQASSLLVWSRLALRE
ncbi:hypothetical protein FB461_0442 [Rarobacter faecitabidus]|uniref:Uncharacterized protein n=1 Tax=Rarobacter faecitabidus TaxID=13243 RepID=A0A542ZUE5_RARFA|nr:hypothetical protein FB461_0442 [Rarobacter faecitabidus]